MFRSILVLPALLMGCAPLLVEDADDAVTGDTDPVGEVVVPEPDAGGVITLTVDATSSTQWTLLDLDEGTVAAGGDPDADPWTLAFQRFNVLTNGGVSGDEGVAVAWLADVDAADVTAADVPAEGWTSDAPDADGDGKDELAMAAWYSYDGTTHVLTPVAGTWFVRTPAAAVFALTFDDYYDAAGTSGVFSLRMVEVAGAVAPEPVEEPGPAAAVTFEVVATDSAAPVYVDLRTGQTLTPDDPTTSLAWDMSLARSTLRLNGGHNGAGAGAAIAETDLSFEAMTTPPTEGWVEDAAPTGPRADGTAMAGWFDYDVTTHTLSPADTRYWVRLADGAVVAFEVLQWDVGGTTGHYELRTRVVREAP